MVFKLSSKQWTDGNSWWSGAVGKEWVLYWSGFSREIGPIMMYIFVYIYYLSLPVKRERNRQTDGEVYSKELSHRIVEAGKSSTWRVAAAGAPEKIWCAGSSTKAVCHRAPFGSGEVSLFVLLGPSADHLRLTHVMVGILLYSKSTGLEVHLIRSHPHRNIQ